MIKKIPLLLVLCAVSLQNSFLHAEEINVSAVLDKRTVSVNEEIHLSIRVSGAEGNIQAPRVPAFEGFDVFYTGRSSQLTFVNNVSSTRVEFSYILIPKVAGKFNLDPIEVTIGPTQYRTSPMGIEVLADQGNTQRSVRSAPSPAAAQTPPASGNYVNPPVQAPLPNYQPEDDNIFVDAWLDKASVYPNEQVLLSYSLYTRYDTRYEGFEEEPEISGFWIEEFPMGRDIARETVRMNGKRYIRAEIRKIALFPTAPAQYQIKPGSIKVSIRQEPQATGVFDEFFNDSFFTGSGFFSRRENRLLKPKMIQLDVKPFPEDGQPSNFKGAVGNFRLTASIDKQKVKQNEPVTLKMVIEGEGNIETLKQPTLPELPQFKVYEADTSSELYKTGNVIGGKKIFEIVFIPTAEGRLSIPPLSFSYFNPREIKYHTLATPEFSLQVEPSDTPFVMPQNLGRQEMFKKGIQFEGKDIRYLDESLPSGWMANAMDVLYAGLALLNILLTAVFVVFILQRRTANLYAKDSTLMRRRRAKSIAESRLKKLLKKRTPENATYFDEIDKILTQYLSDKFGLSAFGTTRTHIESELEKILGSGNALYQDILEVYHICDESRFGGQSHSAKLRSDAVATLKKTVRHLEKAIK